MSLQPNNTVKHEARTPDRHSSSTLEKTLVPEKIAERLLLNTLP